MRARALEEWRAHLASVRPDADPSEADWWHTSWDAATPAAVGFLVPEGFEAYARVLHPAHDQDSRAVRWADVAADCGTTLHPEAQWHRLSGRRDLDARGSGVEPRRWPGNEPDVGCLDRASLEALADTLGRHTATPDASVIGFWVGFGSWPSSWSTLPTTDKPVRESHLFARPVGEVATLCAEAPSVRWAVDPDRQGIVGFRSDGGPALPLSDDDLLRTFGSDAWQSPSAWWPADRAWATYTDVDLDSTLVGGSRALVDDLLADDRLEVLAWPRDGSLWSGADRVNT